MVFEGGDITFRLTCGDPNNPQGFAVFYVPIVSKNQDVYRAIFGYSITEVTKENSRLFPIRDFFEEEDIMGYRYANEFLKDHSIIDEVEEIGGWDIFRSSSCFQAYPESELRFTDKALLNAFHIYMKYFNYINNRIPEPTKENMVDIWKNA